MVRRAAEIQQGELHTLLLRTQASARIRQLAADQLKAAMEDSTYDPHRDVVKQGAQKMIRAALEALADLD
jgi:hypothetical protein